MWRGRCRAARLTQEVVEAAAEVVAEEEEDTIGVTAPRMEVEDTVALEEEVAAGECDVVRHVLELEEEAVTGEEVTHTKLATLCEFLVV